MIRYATLEHAFVRTVPRDLEPGLLYVSMDYATAVHSCCCGCGARVVTPFTPSDWRMTYNGSTISLFPSIGNWQLPCRSHYVIRACRVLEAGPWTNAEINEEMRRDRAAKKRFYSRPRASPPPLVQPIVASAIENARGGMRRNVKGTWAALATVWRAILGPFTTRK